MNKKTFNPNEWLDEEPSISAEPKVDDLKPIPVEQEIDELVSRVESAAIDIAPTYSDWRDLGFALADALGENGRGYYQRLSRFYPNYNSVETDRQFSACLNAHGHGITVKTLFHLAKQAGIDLHTTAKPSSLSEPNILKTSKTAVEVSEVFEDNDPITNERMPTFYESIKETIPDFFKNIVGLANSPEDADLLLLGSLTALSACLPNISGIYDGREVFPNLFLFVTAQASAGKGRLSLCRHLVEPIHKQLREQYAVAMEQYRRQQAEYVINKKNPDAEPPQEPPLKTLLIPANSSSTAVYQVLNNNNGVGLIFETEGDTLANTFKSDFGNFSDGFRKAFHHETISYNRRKDREFVELSRPRLSALLSGTPRQILSLIPDAENGLFSRFIFYCLNVRLVWNDVFAVHDETIDSHFERFGERFFDLYKALQVSQPIRFSLTAQQQAEFHEFFKHVQTEYSSVFGTDFIASVRRLGLITFRIAMIFTSLRIIEIGEFSTTLRCSDSDFYATKTIVETLLKHTAKVYQLLPSATTETAIGSKNQLKQQYFGTLPPDFDKQTAMSVAQRHGIPPKTAERYLKQWCLSGQLNHTAHGKYSKP